MTFEEAFNSECRFKLPPKNGSWPDGFWWRKETNDSVIILYNNPLGSTSYLISDLILNLNEGNLIIIDLKSNEWFLNEEDKHTKDFHNKIEEIINET